MYGLVRLGSGALVAGISPTAYINLPRRLCPWPQRPCVIELGCPTPMVCFLWLFDELLQLTVTQFNRGNRPCCLFTEYLC